MRSFKALLTVSKLREIPPQIMPQSLRTIIRLPSISKISIQYQKQPRDFNRLFFFIKKYAPSIRHYNPTLQFVRNMNEKSPAVPIIKVFSKQNQQQKLLAELNSSNYETQEQLLEQIITLSKQGEKAS